MLLLFFCFLENSRENGIAYECTKEMVRNCIVDAYMRKKRRIHVIKIKFQSSLLKGNEKKCSKPLSLMYT